MKVCYNVPDIVVENKEDIYTMTMKESFQKLLEENPGVTLISKEDVSKIKIKMGKSHRK